MTPHSWNAAEIIRDKGTNRKRFFRGDVDKYTWVDQGSSYVPSEIGTAFLYAQLEMMASITEKRQRQFQFYLHALANLEEIGLMRLPRIPEDCRSNYHIFYIILSDQHVRDRLMAHLHQNGILAVFHYVPLHCSPMGKKFGYIDGHLPVTEDMSRRLLRLPLYHEMTIREQRASSEKFADSWPRNRLACRWPIPLEIRLSVSISLRDRGSDPASCKRCPVPRPIVWNTCRGIRPISGSA